MPRKKLQNKLLTFVNVEANKDIAQARPVSGSIIKIDRYRRLLDDYKSTDDQVLEWLQYIEEFCRTVARNELENYAKKAQSKK